MVLPVRIPDWIIEGDGWHVARGAVLQMWLTFSEESRYHLPPPGVVGLRATATPLSPWPGAELGRHPTRLDADGACIYWDAPSPVAGVVSVRGGLEGHAMDAPEGFPMAAGVVRRVRDLWGGWSEGEVARAVVVGEDVDVSRPPPTHVVTPGVIPGRDDRGSWSGALVDLEVMRRPPGRPHAA
ncbi:hypothetical protein EEW87_016065 [Janibacter melonis]|uniref:Uncharacterized protein n=1 Tax=Janibacter melonis TaxID=262209 RepID=A0A5P8FRB4_9MICO|nr:hypothetical protein [Janibacter melonis]QFQ31524.2 hypothetical protein EEW87_016065 [Janibacter melonis]